MKNAVCQKCGVRGWPETLVSCYLCQDAFEHRYCFEKASDIFKRPIKWACPDCHLLTSLKKAAKIKESNVITPTRRSKRISLKQEPQGNDTTPSSTAIQKSSSSLETDKKRKKEKKVCDVNLKEKPLGSPIEVSDGSLDQKTCSTSEVEKISSQKTKRKDKPLGSPIDVSDASLEQKTCSTSQVEKLSSEKTNKSLLGSDLSIDLPFHEKSVDDDDDASPSSRDTEKGSSLMTDDKRKTKRRKLNDANQKEKPLESPLLVEVSDSDLEQKEVVDGKTEISLLGGWKLSINLPVDEAAEALPISSPGSRPASGKSSSVKADEKRKNQLKTCKVDQKEKPTKSLAEVCNDILIDEAAEALLIVSPGSRSAGKSSSVKADEKRKNKLKKCKPDQKEKPVKSLAEVRDDLPINEAAEALPIITFLKKATKIKESSVITPTRMSKKISLKQDPQGNDTTPSSTATEKSSSSLKTDKKRKKEKKVCDANLKEKPLGSPIDVSHGNHEQKSCSTSEAEKLSSEKTKKSLLGVELSDDLPFYERANDDDSSPSLRDAEKGSSLMTDEKRKTKRRKLNDANQKVKPLESPLVEVSDSDLKKKEDVKVSDSDFEQKEVVDVKTEISLLEGGKLSIDLSIDEAAEASPTVSPSLRPAAGKSLSVKASEKRENELKKCKVDQKEKPAKSLAEVCDDLPIDEAAEALPIVSSGSRSAAGKSSFVKADEKKKNELKTHKADQKEKPAKSLAEVCDDFPIDEAAEALPIVNPGSRSAAEKSLSVKTDEKWKNELKKCKADQKEKSAKSLAEVCNDELEQNDHSAPAEEKLFSEKAIEGLSVPKPAIDHPLCETANKEDVYMVVDPVSVEAPCSRWQLIGDPMEGQTNCVEQHAIVDPLVKVPSFPHKLSAMNPIWGGTFSIINDRFTKVDGVVAHLSSKACARVREEACAFPFFLYPDIVPRSDIWPRAFQNCGLNETGVALYFIPENSAERVFSSLVNYMIRRDLGMKCVLENAELLVFTSVLLPLELRDFYVDEFLWGVFRPKKGGSK